MSLTARRTASWLLVLAIIIAAWTGLRFVPGSGGVSAELRWLLARDTLHAAHTNRAMQLMLLADAERPGARGELFGVLLRDDDRRVVRGALILLKDQLALRQRENEDLYAVLRDWSREVPGQAESTNALLKEVFGPEWRQRCESGSATSQPGAGDGGG